MDGQDHELIFRDVRLTAVVYQHGCIEPGTGSLAEIWSGVHPLSTSQSHGYPGTHSQRAMGALSEEAVCCPQRRESHFLWPQLYPVRNQSLAQQPLS